MSGTTAVDDFLVHLEKERDVSPNTLIAYRRDLDEFVEFLGSYYGVREWTWQGLDRLAIRALDAKRTLWCSFARKIAPAACGIWLDSRPVCGFRSSSACCA